MILPLMPRSPFLTENATRTGRSKRRSAPKFLRRAGARPGVQKFRRIDGQPAFKGTVSANTVFCFREMFLHAQAHVQEGQPQNYARSDAAYYPIEADKPLEIDRNRKKWRKS
jgi:hypothetical protein